MFNRLQGKRLQEEKTMSDSKKLVIVVTNGFDNERSSVAWSVANGGVGMGFEVTMFLVSSGVDWVRKGGAAAAQLNPFDPKVGEMIHNVVESGANILVCPPCAKVRGYEASDFMDGVQIAGSAAMLGVVGQGASTLTF
jgi:predicted peroxiredoxin